jgi:polysaccharide pyruvyl transferase WcaK-like protein
MRNSYQYTQMGAEVLQPTVAMGDSGSIEAMVREISGADFILAGAMHAAIVAHAYGVPFALFAYSYVDCPPKWYDWADSVGIKDVSYVSDIEAGKKWYEQNVAV